MKYEALRDRISDGDLIAVRPTHGGWVRVVQAVTRSPYEHCAVAIEIAGGLWAAEMDGAKNVLVPLSQYEATPFDVFACPVDRARVREDILVTLRGKIRYDWLDILRVGLNELIGLKLPSKDDGRLICSSYAAAIYIRSGWQPRNLPAICTPREVIEQFDRGPIGANEPE